MDPEVLVTARVVWGWLWSAVDTVITATPGIGGVAGLPIWLYGVLGALSLWVVNGYLEGEL